MPAYIYFISAVGVNQHFGSVMIFIKQMSRQFIEAFRLLWKNTSLLTRASNFSGPFATHSFHVVWYLLLPKDLSTVLYISSRRSVYT